MYRVTQQVQAMRNALIKLSMVIVCLLQLFGILQQFCSNSNSSRHVRPPKSNICLDFSRGARPDKQLYCCYYPA